jgi:hypothetical protein
MVPHGALGQHLLHHQFGKPEDTLQDIIEMVGKAARQEANGFQLLRVVKLGFELFALADITGYRDASGHLAVEQQARYKELHGELVPLLAAEGCFQAGEDRLAAGDTLAALQERGRTFWSVEGQAGASEEFVGRIPAQPAERGITEEDLPLHVDNVERIAQGVQNVLIEGVRAREPGQKLTQCRRGHVSCPRGTARGGGVAMEASDLLLELGDARSELLHLLSVLRIVCGWRH